MSLQNAPKIESCTNSSENPKQAVENERQRVDFASGNSTTSIINGIRYLHEVKRLSYSKIAGLLGYSKCRIIELRHNKKPIKNERIQKKIILKLTQVIEDSKFQETGGQDGICY